MNQNWNEEEDYELFKGDLRKLDELIAQLELWRDEKTINHKKEKIRLEEYVELSKNLYELQEEIDANVEAHIVLEETAELAKEHKVSIEAKLAIFKETEDVIHDWIREIKELDETIMKSSLLIEHRAYLDEIAGKEQ